MNRYFVAGYYVEHEDMPYEIDIYKENKDMFAPHELEYEVHHELVDLLNGEFKECVCVKVYIRYDEPVIPDELIPRRIKFGSLTKNLLQVVHLNLEKINDMHGMFDGCTNFLGFNWWPVAGEPFAVTGEVTDTSYMFANCISLVSIDMSRLNTKYVERMECMFKDCRSLKGLCISQYVDNVSTQLCEWDTSNVKSMHGMFEGCESAELLPVDIFNMMYVENTDYMFKNCTSLRNIKFNDHKELVSKEYYPYQRLVTTNEMFYNCESLVELEIPYFDMSRVNACEHEYAGGGKEFITEMRDMFYNCHSLNTITLENFEIYPYQAYENELTFKTFFELLRSGAPNLKSIQITRLNSRLYNPNVTDMSGLFENLTELTEVDLNGWNTKYITDMSHIFHGCVKLERANIDGWDLSNVRYANSMFEDCNSVSYIMLEDKPFKKIASANRMFKNCQALNRIEFNDQSMFEFLAAANEMFYGCTELKNLTIPKFDVRRIGAEKLTPTSIITDMDNIFYDCGNLETLKLDKFKIDNQPSKDTDVPIKTQGGDYRFEYFFDALRNGAPNIKTIEMRDFNNYERPGYNPYITSMKNMFKDFTKVETIDLSDCNTWGITDMSYMFANCAKLASLDLTSFRTNDVTNMEGMFKQTTSLKQLNISNFDFGKTTSLKYFLYNSDIEVLPMYNFGSTGNVTDMSFMFCLCWSLQGLPGLECLNTENVTNMASMFWGCSKVEGFDLYNFNTDKVTNMSNMFKTCKKLNELDLSAFNTHNVKNYQSMFEGCELIQKLDLSHFRGMDSIFMADKCFSSMFKDCKNLEILDISGFTGKMKSSKDAEYMFSGCEKLRYIDMSNFRHANDNLYNGLSVFAKVGLNSSDNILNIGMLYINDVETCKMYAKKFNDEVDKNINRINIYVQDIDADECMKGFDSDIRIRFIKYTNKVIRIDLPMPIPAKRELCWDANLREYYIEGEPTGIHEKIKIPTFPTTMHLDFNPWCERDDDGNIMGEKDVEYVKVQIPMKEKIEEESDK